jgi:hypothetical protein
MNTLEECCIVYLGVGIQRTAGKSRRTRAKWRRALFPQRSAKCLLMCLMAAVDSRTPFFPSAMAVTVRSTQLTAWCIYEPAGIRRYHSQLWYPG